MSAFGDSEIESLLRKRWREILEETGKNAPGLAVLIDLASRDAVLGALFPMLSVGRLCFSRCTEYPFYVDVLISQDGDEFVVERTVGQGGHAESEPISRGSAVEAVENAAAFLPAGYGPALQGNSDARLDEFNRAAAQFRSVRMRPEDPTLDVH